MEPKFQSSFIPKGPIASSGSVKTSSPKKKSIYGVISTAVFTIAVLASVGVFAYNFYLNYRITSMGQDIESARADIQPDVIEEITRLDARINSTETLLNNHSIISPLFSFLEESTVRAVRFTELVFDTTEEGLAITIKGQAQGYSAVALQSEIFNDSGNFEDPVFSDLRLDNEGNVNFLFTGLINPELLSYKRVIENAPAPVVPAVNPVSTSTPVTVLPAGATSTPTGGGEATSTPSI